jgi:hypothetical protein
MFAILGREVQIGQWLTLLRQVGHESSSFVRVRTRVYAVFLDSAGRLARVPCAWC